jgi:hypothetical protein
MNARDPQKPLSPRGDELLIQRHDDLFDAASIDAVQTFFEQQVRWSYGWRSVNGLNPLSHWNHDFLKTRKNNQQDQTPRLAADPALKAVAALWATVQERCLPGHALLRCYANAHTYGVEGYPHVDAPEPGQKTVVIYLNPRWQPDWAGETVFFDAEGDIVHAVLPKPGRAVIFDGSILHAARGVSRICTAARVTLMFKAGRAA